MILVIDNQSAFLKKFKRQYLVEQEFECIYYDHNEPLIIPNNKQIKGIILSGGKGTPYEPLNLTTNYVALMNYEVPIMGFCLGHEIIAVAYKGRIKKMETPQNRKDKISIDKNEDEIFNGITSSEIIIQKKHHHHVIQAPPTFNILGHSQACPIEIMKHKEKPIYSFQGHPEVSGKDGITIMENFFKICGVL